MPPRDYALEQKNNSGATIALIVDGQHYTLDPTDITAAHELELWRETGLRLSQIVDDVASAPALFHVAAIVFLARRSRGDNVKFADVASAITVGSDINIDDTTDTADTIGGGGPPEQPASGSERSSPS